MQIRLACICVWWFITSPIMSSLLTCLNVVVAAAAVETHCELSLEIEVRNKSCAFFIFSVVLARWEVKEAAHIIRFHMAKQMTRDRQAKTWATTRSSTCRRMFMFACQPVGSAMSKLLWKSCCLQWSPIKPDMSTNVRLILANSSKQAGWRLIKLGCQSTNQAHW